MVIGKGCCAAPIRSRRNNAGRSPDAVDARLGKLVHLDFVEDSELLAGVRLSLGAWQLDLSLAGELGVFAEAGRLDH
jgi:hypothetical protein